MTDPHHTMPHPEHAFAPERKAGVYDAIYQRRDIRSFLPDRIPDSTIAALLKAAHHAPSVGFMQPWNFLLIADVETKQRVHDLFAQENQAAALFFPDGRRDHYLTLKLAGILEAPINLCVTCDPTRGGTQVLGRNSIPETDVYSTATAVQNLWLAARAEGVGVGWVSILKNAQLREILQIPPHIIPVAYLCLGYVAAFEREPELQRKGWARRTPLSDLVYYEGWGQRAHQNWPELSSMLRAEDRQSGLKHILDTLTRIAPIDAQAAEAAARRQQQLTKPAGSLGRLEALAIQIAGITGHDLPALPRKAVLIMAADHGVTAEGISAYPSDVTAQMVLNFLSEGAAINALARQAGARVVVVDIGVASPIQHARLLDHNVARGTANMAVGPAMSRAAAIAAINVGLEVIAAQIAAGLDLVALGEMGIGNTTAASALTAAITSAPVATITGHGTGISDPQRLHKIAVIERALRVNEPDLSDPIDVLAKVGGLEIAGLVGVILGATAAHLPIVLDGFITGAAALIAAELSPGVIPYLIASHTSVEQGHRRILERLQLVGLLDLQLRLGEGSGAALALPIIDAALAVHRAMATFTEAGVATKIADTAPEPAEDASAAQPSNGAMLAHDFKG